MDGVAMMGSQVVAVAPGQAGEERDAVRDAFLFKQAAVAVHAARPGMKVVLEIALKGRTPGKRAAGVRIVTLEGQTPDVSALLIRNVFRLIDSLPVFYVVGLICVLLSARQVRIGDMAAGTLLVYEKKLASNAFERFAAPADGALDLPAMEVAQDLLARWKTLAPDKRSQIAAKLIAGQGQTLPANVSKRAFDREMHKRLVSLAHARRT